MSQEVLKLSIVILATRTSPRNINTSFPPVLSSTCTLPLSIKIHTQSGPTHTTQVHAIIMHLLHLTWAYDIMTTSSNVCSIHTRCRSPSRPVSTSPLSSSLVVIMSFMSPTRLLSRQCQNSFPSHMNKKQMAPFTQGMSASRRHFANLLDQDIPNRSI